MDTIAQTKEDDEIEKHIDEIYLILKNSDITYRKLSMKTSCGTFQLSFDYDSEIHSKAKNDFMKQKKGDKEEMSLYQRIVEYCKTGKEQSRRNDAGQGE